MPQSDRFHPFLSQFSFLNLANHKLVLNVLANFLTGFSGLAQEQSPAPAAVGTQTIAPIAQTSILVPAGTRFPLVLTHPIQSRYVHRGDDVYAQITAPIISGNEVVIPLGTLVQGKVDKLERKGGRGELHLQSMSIAFPNGYVAPISEPVTLESNNGYALKDPGKGRAVSAFLLPAAGAGLGALIGHFVVSSKGATITTTLPPGCVGPPPGCLSSSLTGPSNRGKGIVIGSAVGGGIGMAASGIVMLASSRHFYLDAGSPVEMTLQQPLSLDRARVADAVTQSGTPPVQAISPAPRTTINTGRSSWDCPVGEEWCGGRCVNTINFMNDSSNCGRCGNHCSMSETCTGGFCGCGGGSTSCMGSCVSAGAFMSDNNNCGRCGHSCSIGESCMGGTCMRTSPCTPGDITCH